MIRKYRESLKNILHSESDAFALSAGFGVGVFIGFLPIYGFQTIASILAAYLLKRVNKLSLIFATQLFLPFVIPPVVAINYITGTLLLHRKLTFLKINDISDVLKYFIPIFAGSLLNGAVFGALSFFLLFKFISHIRSKDRNRKK